MATTAQYASIPKTSGAKLSVANPNRDGTGAVQVFFPQSPTGARVDDINIVATATTTAGMIRIFIRNAGTTFLFRELVVTPTIASATTPTFSVQLTNLAWLLEAGWELLASTEKGEPFDVTVTRGGAL